jgi:alpha-tubulin suppressor-like RCC1 family protein
VRFGVVLGAVALVSAALVTTSVPNVAEAALPTNFTSISAGGNINGVAHTCAITDAAALQCWGSNVNGQLGDGTAVDKRVPTNVNGMSTGVDSVSAGGGHTCALKTDDSVWCWGLNNHGQIGTGGTDPTPPGNVVPFNVTSQLPDVQQIATGSEHTCALTNAGGVWCWGESDNGQGGRGVEVSAFRPQPVCNAVDKPASSPGDPPRSCGTENAGNSWTATAVAVGGNNSCAITSTGGVKCWGRGDVGGIGDGGNVNRFRPTDVPGLTSVIDLAVGGAHACALTSGGGVKCWGANAYGQVGVSPSTAVSTPVDVTGLTSGVESISAGGRHTCAVLTSGAVECWGANANGQLGQATNTPANQFTPIEIPGLDSGTASVSAGALHSCVLMDVGKSACWGGNVSGQLGDGTAIEKWGPFLPEPPRSVTTIGGDTQVTVNWTVPEDDGGFPITEYTVTATPGGASQVISAPTLTALFTGLANGTAYTFTVKATNSIGVGHVSLPSAAVTPAGPPGAPSGISVAPGDGSASLQWGAAPANGASVQSYAISVTPGNKTATVAGNKTTVLITGLENGKEYTFKATAKNRVGVGPSASVNGKLPIPKSGYWMLGADGNIYRFGDARYFGRASYAFPSSTSAVAMKPLADGSGYWIVDSVGKVSAFGNAQNFGGRPPLLPGEKVSTLSATPTAKGYWLFTNRGRAFRYGDAKFYGDMSGVALNGPVIASSATPSGKGYYMVASDGGVFAFGDARFYGSTGSMRLNKPVVGLSPDPDNKGYWLVATDGGVFAFQAPFRGSTGSMRLNKPVNGLVPFGNGYLMVASDGGVFNFSNKPFYGSLGSNPPAAPVIGIAAFVH